ncbi:Mu transposase C-terminal domain-containing protein [Pseudomonas sp. NPDC089408]|uniref:Mu transposase C-terminal domain-containing protein n=1 Tax=Pseudomonas sp. NPDC089408 TaxID=3364465 RepID=UPI002853B88A|nr:transposase family protein [Pseudomonas carnis]
MDHDEPGDEVQESEKNATLVPVKNAQAGIPRDWKESGVPESIEVIPYQVKIIDQYEEQLANERISVFDQVDQGLPAKRGMELLGLKKSHFYKLLDDHRNGKDIVRNHKGTPKGGNRSTSGQVAALNKAFESHYEGPKASISELLKWARRYCEETGVKPVSRHTARRFLYEIPEKDRDRKILTTDQFNQKYGYRPKKLIIDGLLRRVSMDHTRVDILLVDEFNRNVIIGRPWITMIICDRSRVILGFYLSMEAPNINTVAAALAFAIMHKESSLFCFVMHPGEYPFHGIPFVIFTDNAAEFTSEAFIQQCKEWGMEWEHRPIGKKWYGGIIERVIGSFMTTGVHFLPGSTGSNVVERQSFESELNAKMDFKQCAEWMMKEVTLYHGKIHRTLGCTPREAFAHYRSEGKYDFSRVIGKEEEERFLIDFCPTSFNHRVHSYGINFAGRRYAGDALEEYVGQRLDVKYLQHDLSYIWVKAPSAFLKIRCVYTRAGLSMHWESYSNHKQLSKRMPALINKASGTVDDDFARAAMDRQEEIIQEAEVMKTAFMDAPKQLVLPAPPPPPPSTEKVDIHDVEEDLIDDSKIYVHTDENVWEEDDIFQPQIIPDPEEIDLLIPVLIIDPKET